MRLTRKLRLARFQQAACQAACGVGISVHSRRALRLIQDFAHAHAAERSYPKLLDPLSRLAC